MVLVGDSVQFFDQSENEPTSWEWHFEGGIPSASSEQNPYVSYDSAGIYNVYLSVSNSAGTDSLLKSGFITVVENDSVVEYCSFGSSNYSYEWVSEVQIGSFSNSSSGASYSDFTNKTINLTVGDTATIELTPGFRYRSYIEYWKVWIDYNKDGDFDDSGENVYSDYGRAVVSGEFSVSDISATTRMRIAMKYLSSPVPCETFVYGEAEDYTVNITRSSSVLRRATSSIIEKTESKFLVYPNPVSENLYLSTDAVNAEIKIVNMVGTIVKAETVYGDNYEINVSELPAGLYTIYLNNNGRVLVRKFLKQ